MQQLLLTPAQVGQVLTTRRKAHNIPQGVIAQRLGISQNRFSELEQDPARLTLDRLLALVGSLGLELVIQDKGAPSSGTPSEW